MGMTYKGSENVAWWGTVCRLLGWGGGTTECTNVMWG